MAEETGDALIKREERRKKARRRSRGPYRKSAAIPTSGASHKSSTD